MILKAKKGFTLIELMVIVLIIIILSISIYTAIANSKKNARVNSAKTTLKSVMTALVSCGVSGGNPGDNPTNTSQNICDDGSIAKWPPLPKGYTWEAGGNYGYACDFSVDVNDDLPSGFLTCNCVKQKCE